RRARSMKRARLPMTFQHPLPALAQGRDEPNDLIDDRRIHPKTCDLQAMRAVVVEPREVLHQLAAVVEIERARQAVEQVDAAIETARLELIALGDDVCSCARQLRQQPVSEDEDELHRRGLRRLRGDIDRLIAEISFLIHNLLAYRVIRPPELRISLRSDS